MFYVTTVYDVNWSPATSFPFLIRYPGLSLLAAPAAPSPPAQGNPGIGNHRQLLPRATDCVSDRSLADRCVTAATHIGINQRCFITPVNLGSFCLGTGSMAGYSVSSHAFTAFVPGL
jgi:hypothetical protein